MAGSFSEFIFQPKIDGALLQLRPLFKEDFEPLYQAASDPLIWSCHPKSDRYKRPVFEDFFNKAIEATGSLAVIDKATGHIIGTTRYYNLNAEEKQITIGFTFLARNYWGGIYNGELKKLMLDHAFKTFNHVLFEIGEVNLRSQKAIEKIGAKILSKTVLDGAPYLIFKIDKK